ncbi:hypothetical protein LV779_28285 [Streptomyces thinghirensis]|nr:hypothetical protein [Streptomyces thinghirensis]
MRKHQMEEADRPAGRPAPPRDARGQRPRPQVHLVALPGRCRPAPPRRRCASTST